MICKSEKANYYYVMLDTCDCSVLRHLVHPRADFIWIHRHWPEPALRWWSTDVPISPNDVVKDIEVRAMEYDMMMSRAEFLANLDRFVPHGISLTQLTRRVPDSLWLASIPEERQSAILLDNGMKTQFELPHAGEVAQFSASDLDHIEEVCRIAEIRDLVLQQKANKSE